MPLAAGENVIGRATDGLITLPSSKVSRRHARIVVSNGRVVLEDLGSRNGTYLGDRRIDSAVELKNGDRIGIGPALLIFCAAADDALTSMQSAAFQIMSLTAGTRLGAYEIVGPLGAGGMGEVYRATRHAPEARGRASRSCRRRSPPIPSGSRDSSAKPKCSRR